jgi:hypothetical protein
MAYRDATRPYRLQILIFRDSPDKRKPGSGYFLAGIGTLGALRAPEQLYLLKNNPIQKLQLKVFKIEYKII